MSNERTRTVMNRFGDAFANHDPSLLDGLLHEECVLENTGPAPDGSRHVGRGACLGFWAEIARNERLNFETEDMWLAGERAVGRWRLRWGPGERDHVRGVNIMRLRDGLIVEALGYIKG